MMAGVPYARKREAILDWFRRPQEARCSVDILNRDFVQHYTERVAVRVYPMPYGADKCPDLGATLSRMEKEGALQRVRAGTNGIGMGFPKWVWSYRLRDTLEIL